MTNDEIIQPVANAMKAWAAEHPEADTQGLDDDEWLGLAEAAANAVGLLFVKRAIGLTE